MSARGSRAWCFTVNNYTQEDIDNIMALEKIATYMVCGEEIAPTTGTPHLQGYIHFKDAKTFPSVRKKIRGHIEPAFAGAWRNEEYTTKEGRTIHTFGSPPHQGARSDIYEMRSMAKGGATLGQMIDRASSYQSLKTAETLAKYAPPRERDIPKVLWFWGPTGTGKTRTAVELGGKDYWISSRALKWWDGYIGQRTIIIDDFRDNYCPFTELLRMTDRYPFRVETKGSSQWLNADTIIITAPHPPSEYYRNVLDESKDQLMRRITEIRQFPIETMEWPDEDIFA